MGICPNCGDWVDEGDICMSCGGAGYGSGDDAFDGSGISGYYREPSPDVIEKRRKRDMKGYLESYKDGISAARAENDYKARMKHYSDALDNVQKYWEMSERSGLDPYDMPDMRHALSPSDVQWLKERHYASYSNISLFSKNDEKDELEDILKRSGNRSAIRENGLRYDAVRWSIEQERRIENIKSLRQDYFRHIEEANKAVDDGKLKKAMNEYRRANDRWADYFASAYKVDPHWQEMPENGFFEDDVEHMMVLYVKTHPLLTSKKKHLKIHSEIVDMLDGKWDCHIEEADRRAQEILDEKHRKRQELFYKAGDVIVGARIIGDKVLQRVRK